MNYFGAVPTASCMTMTNTTALYLVYFVPVLTLNRLFHLPLFVHGLSCVSLFVVA